MAFPTRPDTATTSSVGNTTHTVNLPANIAAGNGLQVECFEYIGNTLTTPTDWALTASTVNGYYVFTKTATGSEGATVSITASGAGNLIAVSERIAGTSGNVEAATALSNSLDVPSLTPSWGAKDTLWITPLASNVGISGTDDSVPPTNYGNMVSRAVGFVGLATAYRELNASSEDPGSWTQAEGAGRVTLVAWEPAADAAVYLQDSGVESRPIRRDRVIAL